MCNFDKVVDNKLEVYYNDIRQVITRCFINAGNCIYILKQKLAIAN